MPDHDKIRTLRDEGTLNSHPEAVVAPGFHQGEFFDPRDLVQVKYEMLRRVRVDDVAVTQAAAEFGFSRPTFYEAQANFEEAGIAGLVPKKRGPRGPHKLHGDVMAILERLIVADQPLRARELARQLREELGVEVHPRTIERAVGARKKKPG